MSKNPTFKIWNGTGKDARQVGKCWDVKNGHGLDCSIATGVTLNDQFAIRPWEMKGTEVSPPAPDQLSEPTFKILKGEDKYTAKDGTEKVEWTEVGEAKEAEASAGVDCKLPSGLGITDRFLIRPKE